MNNQSNELLLQVVHIEDNENDGELIRMTLNRGGAPCHIQRVSTRAEFQAAVENKEVDLVLSDSKVPGFDAFGALKYTHLKKPDLPFVFVSGNAGPQLKKEALSLGATDYIPKEDLAPLIELMKKLWIKKTAHLPKKLPPVGKYVVVQCPGFRCLGYLDYKGQWRDFARSEVLPEVLDWFET